MRLESKSLLESSYDYIYEKQQRNQDSAIGQEWLSSSNHSSAKDVPRVAEYCHSPNKLVLGEEGQF